MKALEPVPGCIDMLACNYNPEATADDGSCSSARDGYDCSGAALEVVDGATYFIQNPREAMALTQNTAHAEVDIPEEVVFQVGSPLFVPRDLILFIAAGTYNWYTTGINDLCYIVFDCHCRMTIGPTSSM